MDVKPFIPGAAGSHTTSPATVQLHALSAGHFSLPEEQFVKPATVGARTTVPSLCFLMQHHSRATGTITRIVFDLGVRRDTSRYSEPIRRHLATRQPLNTEPDVVASLALGGLSPGDIDLVIYSHVRDATRALWKAALMINITAPLGPCRRASGLPQQCLHCRPRLLGHPAWHRFALEGRPFFF